MDALTSTCGGLARKLAHVLDYSEVVELDEPHALEGEDRELCVVVLRGLHRHEGRRPRLLLSAYKRG